MLDFIKNNMGWVVAIVLIAIVGYVLLNKKYPITKTIVLIIAVFACGVGAIFCGYNSYVYLSASGNITGIITGNYGEPTTEVKELTFTIQNMELRPTENEGEYSATLTIYKNLVMDKGKDYSMFLNDEPCTYTLIDGDHVNAKFDYNFYDKEDNVELNDELFIYLSINTNYTTLEIVSKGGDNAAKYWHSYFGKNNCVLEFKPVEQKLNEGDVNYGEGEVTYVTATYTIDGEHYMTQVYQPNSVVTFPEFNNELYAYWSTDGESRILTDYTITEDTNFVAMYHTNAEFCSMAYGDMVLGVLDLSKYPITTIPSQIFSERTAIKEVKLPSTLITIGSGAFQYTSLTSVTIPEGVLNINNYAFKDTPITSVSLPESLVNIGWGAFANCTNLTQIELKANVQSIGTNVGGLEVYIVEGSIEDGTATSRIMTEAFYGCDLTINCLFAEGVKSFSEDWNYNGKKYLEVTYFGQPGTGENTEDENQNQGTNKDPITNPDEELGDE